VLPLNQKDRGRLIESFAPDPAMTMFGVIWAAATRGNAANRSYAMPSPPAWPVGEALAEPCYLAVLFQPLPGAVWPLPITAVQK